VQQPPAEKRRNVQIHLLLIQKTLPFKKNANMKKLFNQLIVGAIAIFMVACNTDSTDSKTAETSETKDSQVFDLTTARSSIEAENVKFIDAFKKGDSTSVAAFYADDAMILPPNMESVKANSIAAFWGSFMKMGVKDFKLITDDVAGNEAQLVETGRYEIYGTENKLMDKGKYVVAWKTVNGTWKLYRDIFNSDMPAAPAK
jgi:ketosteroid isomerase-like protein